MVAGIILLMVAETTTSSIVARKISGKIDGPQMNRRGDPCRGLIKSPLLSRCVATARSETGKSSSAYREAGPIRSTSSTTSAASF